MNNMVQRCQWNSALWVISDVFLVPCPITRGALFIAVLLASINERALGTLISCPVYHIHVSFCLILHIYI